jgi:UDP-N-acetylglucosamine acyltransferase
VTGSIDPKAIVHEGARIGNGSRLGPLCVIEEGVVLGDGCEVEPFARICRKTVLGARVRIGQGAVIEGLAQVRAPDPEGVCLVGDDARIGEYATVHRSCDGQGRTEVGRASMVLAYAHVAHDCLIGEGSVIANGVQLGGHVQVGRYAFMGGGTHVHQHTRIGELAFAAGGIRLDRDLAPWSRAMGEPPRWAGLNRVAFGRAGNPPDPVRAMDALRTLFRRGLRLEEAMARLEEAISAEAATLLQFIQGGRRGLLRPEG